MTFWLVGLATTYWMVVKATDRDLCLLVCPEKDLPCLVEGGKILVAKCRTNTRYLSVM